MGNVPKTRPVRTASLMARVLVRRLISFPRTETPGRRPRRSRRCRSEPALKAGGTRCSFTVRDGRWRGWTDAGLGREQSGSGASAIAQTIPATIATTPSTKGRNLVPAGVQLVEGTKFDEIALAIERSVNPDRARGQEATT